MLKCFLILSHARHLVLILKAIRRESISYKEINRTSYQKTTQAPSSQHKNINVCGLADTKKLILMKKIFFLLGMAISFASCTTTTKTASTADMPATLLSATVADLEFVTPERISLASTAAIKKEIQRGGLTNVKKAAENELLEKYKADVLVEPEYIISKTRYLFRTKISAITVSGRPAKYTNFHSLNDSVWCNPVFRARMTNSIRNDEGGLLKGVFGK